jgi:hypothetical protein
MSRFSRVSPAAAADLYVVLISCPNTDSGCGDCNPLLVSHFFEEFTAEETLSRIFEAEIGGTVRHTKGGIKGPPSFETFS